MDFDSFSSADVDAGCDDGEAEEATICGALAGFGVSVATVFDRSGSAALASAAAGFSGAADFGASVATAAATGASVGDAARS